MLFTLPYAEFKQIVRMSQDAFAFIESKIRGISIFLNAGRNKQKDVWIQMLVLLSKFIIKS